MTKRFMTDREIQIYRLCHHQFKGLSQETAAERAGISQQSVSRILAKIKKEHPELFPILNPRQDLIYSLIVGRGFTHQQVADFVHVSIRTVERTVGQLRRKGVCFNSPAKAVKYENYMDDNVEHKY